MNVITEMSIPLWPAEYKRLVSGEACSAASFPRHSPLNGEQAEPSRLTHGRMREQHPEDETSARSPVGWVRAPGFPVRPPAREIGDAGLGCQSACSHKGECFAEDRSCIATFAPTR